MGLLEWLWRGTLRVCVRGWLRDAHVVRWKGCSDEGGSECAWQWGTPKSLERLELCRQPNEARIVDSQVEAIANMGLLIALQTGQGEKIDTVEDPRNLLHNLLPHGDRTGNSKYLKFIDWYGDTMFNYLQMDDFIREIEMIRAECRSHAESELVDRLISMGNKCRERRWYIYSYGD